MTRQEALQTLQFYTKSQALIRHHLAVEAAMKAVAQKLIERSGQGINIDTWGLVGLLHDADYEITRKTPEKHTLYLEEKLGNVLAQDVLQAIKSHNSKYTKVHPRALMDWALYAIDELTGIIITLTLQQKEKKIHSVSSIAVLNYINSKSFERSPMRAQIVSCETELRMPIAEFVGVVLLSMQAIANELGFEG